MIENECSDTSSEEPEYYYSEYIKSLENPFTSEKSEFQFDVNMSINSSQSFSYRMCRPDNKKLDPSLTYIKKTQGDTNEYGKLPLEQEFLFRPENYHLKTLKAIKQVASI